MTVHAAACYKQTPTEPGPPKLLRYNAGIYNTMAP